MAAGCQRRSAGRVLFLAMQESPEQWTDLYTLASCAQFGYIGWRIFSVRKTTILDLKQGAIAAGAPLVVWLETMSLAAGFLMAAQTGLRFAESGADHWLFWLMEVFCAVLLLMPLLNFLTLGRYKKKSEEIMPHDSASQLRLWITTFLCTKHL
jgi:hypothetical protein